MNYASADPYHSLLKLKFCVRYLLYAEELFARVAREQDLKRNPATARWFAVCSMTLQIHAAVAVWCRKLPQVPFLGGPRVIIYLVLCGRRIGPGGWYLTYPRDKPDLFITRPLMRPFCPYSKKASSYRGAYWLP